jgi:hypothetical protein
MQTEYVPTGRASALEIRGGIVTAIYTDRRDVIGRLSSVHESLTVRRNP